ncbi:MAG: DUF1249 domain-containing protein [Gammaproteobacteria bacterium]|nr:DUF1249 domain-containing protein [Gammaproteobacteria bacterium]
MAHIMFGGRVGGVGLQKAGRKRYSIDLNAHMAVCEANYARLMRLMHMLDDRDRSAFAMTLGEIEPHVTLRVVARYKYTTEVELTQHHAREGVSEEGVSEENVSEEVLETAPETTLSVRMYHDAKCAEVIAFQDQRAFRAVYGYPNRQMRHPDEKVQVNRFLGEFLHMCITHGISLEQPGSGNRLDGLRVTLRA